ncbi:hypothetical protein Tco_0747145 [Tanacetum coccineum]
MYCDNTGAVAIGKDHGVTKDARHFRAKVHYLRETIEMGDVRIEKVDTYDNLADLFMKALAFPKHSELTKKIGMIPANSLILLLQLPSGSCWNMVVGFTLNTLEIREPIGGTHVRIRRGDFHFIEELEKLKCSVDAVLSVPFLDDIQRRDVEKGMCLLIMIEQLQLHTFKKVSFLMKLRFADSNDGGVPDSIE